MSAVAYSETHQLPAGALALVVHGAFFALLYFGVNWQAQPPQGMVVDIWDSLPEPRIARVVAEPPPLAKVEPPAPVETVRAVAPPKADIEIEKIKPQARPPEVKTPVAPPKPIVPEQTDAQGMEMEAWLAQQEMAEHERIRADQAAAVGRMMDEHKARIVAKIRRNIVMPPDIPNNAKAEFDVTLLPGGSVLSVKPRKPSGYPAYDSAVERAIFKAQPLPLPLDASLFGRFRELHLKFSSGE